MTEWLRLGDVKDLPESTSTPDFVLDVVLSPYDIRESVRGFRASEGKLRIEFRYIDGEEQGTVVKVGPHVTATEGKHSGRLLAMDIDVVAIGASSVGVSIATLDSAWDEVAKSLGMRSRERGEIAAKARKAVATRQEDLLGQLVES